MGTANNAMAPAADDGEGRDAANIPNLHEQVEPASAKPMHTAAAARDQGMARTLNATTPQDRAAIVSALLRGLDPLLPLRAEDALPRAGFEWPAHVSPRCLGAIVSHLARTGLIVEQGWTKGRKGRSHAGRVSLWLRVGGGAP
jgi:hypothetical protein